MKVNWRAWAGKRSLKQRAFFLFSALTIALLFQNCAPGFETMKLASVDTVTPAGDSTSTTDPSNPVTPVVPDVPIDPNASLSVYARNASVLEGGEMKFRVELNKTANLPVNVTLRTNAASAIANTHFEPLATTVTIPTGQTSLEVAVQTLMPIASAANSTFNLEITNVSAGAIAQRTGTGTIRASRQPIAFKQIAMGQSHSCALTVALGKVYCWGNNRYGQLGNGTTVSSGNPIEVVGLTGIKRIAVGISSACAITATNTLKCWGMGLSGELGNGIRADSAVPVDAVNVTDAVLDVIPGSGGRSCILTLQGEVKCWGNFGAYFPPGSNTGTSVFSLTPVLVPGITGATGLSRNCVLGGDGSVSCWSWTVTNATTATPIVTTVPGLVGAKRLARGQGHTCVITATDTVACWGDNTFNQLGNFNIPSATAPTEIAGLTGMKDVAAGERHSCAITATDTLKCWGNTSAGQLGMGFPSFISNPIDVPGVAGVKQVIANFESTCVIGVGDNARCWGRNSDHQIGPVTVASSALPRHLPNLVGAKHVSAGFDHTCAVTANDTAVCWGSNIVGQLGGLNGNGSYIPFAVPGLTGLTSVALGRHHSCGLTNTGGVVCWGQGLAVGPSPIVATPVAGITGAKQLVAGEYFTCVRTANDAVQCWGTSNPYGSGGFINSATPTVLAGFSGVKQIGAAGGRVCAITATDTVQCVGEGFIGGLTTPIEIAGLTGIRQIGVGANHLCALTAANTLACLGSNREGQLGNGVTDTAISLTPVAVNGLTGIKQVAASNFATCAITATDTVKCWGYGVNGELGNGGFNSSLTPVDVVHLTKIRQLSGNGQHFTALGMDGRVRQFGISSSYVTAAGPEITLPAAP